MLTCVVDNRLPVRLCRWLRFSLSALLFAAVLTACDDDEGAPLPAYRIDLVEALTGGGGAVERLVLDNGDTLTVNNPRQGYVPDTLYRLQAMYVESTAAPGRVKLYALTSVLAPMPVTMDAEKVVSDPVDVVSAWCSGNYMNLRLNIKTHNIGHFFGFVYDAMAIYPDGSRVLCLTLYHYRNNDLPAYTREVVLSCPLAWTGDELQRGRDSVMIRLNSETEGITQRVLPYR